MLCNEVKSLKWIINIMEISLSFELIVKLNEISELNEVQVVP